MKESLQQIIGFRMDKLKTLREKGIDPYPSKARRSLDVADFLMNFPSLKKSKRKATLVGRLMGWREFGGLTFGVLKDFSGEVQVMFKKDSFSEKAYKDLGLIDVGDILQLTGSAFVTKKGEPTLLVSKMKLLAKSLRPLPEKWHGLQDLETRFRQRYLDLLFNPKTKERFVLRHRIVQAIRQFLIEKDFIEVDTPALQPLPGGALATPFKTYYYASGADVYLRIAPELYLKRLVIGGFEKVFEFARVFRNEGVSTHHLPDFTMLEFYQAYATYEDLIKLTEKMFEHFLKKVFGSTRVKLGTKTIDFKTPWPRRRLRDLIKQETGIDVDRYLKVEDLQKEIKRRKINLTYAGKAGRGKLIDELYKEMVRPKLLGPILLVDHPLELSPLAKRREDELDKAQRFQLVLGGAEIVNAFTELNDPIEQRERFKEQAKLRKAGDLEAHLMDDDFIKALEYGMPPTAGWGMGIERLLSVLTGAESIREAVIFPFVKSK